LTHFLLLLKTSPLAAAPTNIIIIIIIIGVWCLSSELHAGALLLESHFQPIFALYWKWGVGLTNHFPRLASNWDLLFFLFIYSHVHTLFGSFILPPHTEEKT
jgi:hypothetical protein